MSGAAPFPGVPRAASLAYALWALAWLCALGGLAYEAWISRPVPTGLPVVGGTATRARPLCVVVLDGVREGALWDEPTSMPWLRAFADRGAGGVALAGDPTLTAACVRTLLTGRRPDLKIALQNFNAPPVEGSWLEALRRLGARAAHGGDAGIAQMAAPWLDPADVLAFPDQGPVDQGLCDAKAVPFVLERARAGYDLLTLHLTGPDHAGHKHGAGGEPYAFACRRADGQVREVVEAFLARHPEGTVLVAADHGVSLAGTHGGGEMSARRAPFVLRGPGVARRLGLELEQAALAPTLAALLGLAQPPLADAPPEPALLALPAAEVQRALDAHVQARLWVARAVGRGDQVGAIEQRRARAAETRLGLENEHELRRLSAELDLLLKPDAPLLRWGASLLAVLGLLALVLRVPSSQGGAFGGLASAGAALLVFVAALPALSAPAVIAAGLAASACLLALLSRPAPLPRAAAWTVAVVLALVVVTGVGSSFQSIADDGVPPATAWTFTAAGVLVAVGLLVLVPRGALRAAGRRLAGLAPALLPALAGGGLGFLLALRPFVDPWVPLNAVVAALAAALLVPALRATRRDGAPRGLVAAVLTLSGAMLLAPFAVTGFRDAAGWSQTPPWHVTAWALAGLAIVLGVLAALPRPWSLRADRPHVLTALAALGLAFAGRWLSVPGSGAAVAARVVLAFGPQVLALLALGLALRTRGSAEGRLAARLTAVLALLRRLTASDGEFALLAAFALLCALGARLPAPATRRGLGGLAALLLVVHVVAFHASGGSETWGRMDVNQGYLGLEEFVATGAAIAPTGAGGVTWQVLVATVQVSVRFGAPWVLLLAAALHAVGGAARGRVLLGDLALGVAARGTALVLCLWTLSVNAWWVEKAREVYSLGAGDLILLLVAGAAVGLWRREPVEAPASSPEVRAARRPADSKVVSALNRSTC